MRRFYAFLISAALLLMPLSPVEAAESVTVPILMYHEVSLTDFGKDVISPEELESDIVSLLREGFAPVVMEDLIRYVSLGEALPDKPVVLTFDDGFRNTYVLARPILEKYGVPIVLSLIGKGLDDFTLWPSDSLLHTQMTWTEAAELSSLGIAELQNHSYELHAFPGCVRREGQSESDYAAMLREDALRMQEALYTRTGTCGTVFTYPYGYYDPASDDILLEAGFSATLTCDFGINRLAVGDKGSLYGMKRICRVHGRDVLSLLTEAEEFTSLAPSSRIP